MTRQTQGEIRPNSTQFHAAARDFLLGRGLLLQQGDNTVIAKPFGAWVDLLAEVMEQANRQAAGLLQAAETGYTEVYSAAAALGGVAELLSHNDSTKGEAAEVLVKLLSSHLGGIAITLDDACIHFHRCADGRKEGAQ